MDDNRNLFIVIALSLAIILGWQYLVVDPMTPTPAPQTTTQTAPAATDPATGAPPAPGTAPAAPVSAPSSATLSRDQALALAGGRVNIDSTTVDGSLSLTGGRFDDLHLRHYRETTDPKSPEVTLLSPKGTGDPYYAAFGWVAAPEAGLTLPNDDTLWTQVGGDTLKPGQPVTLRYDNGQGLVFTRTIELDQDYMFLIRDKVENSSANAVSLYPYGLVARLGTPHTQQIWVVHEGMVGVLKGTLNEHTYSDMQDSPLVAEETTGGWLGITDHYWMATVVPDQNETVAARYTFSSASGHPASQADFQYKTPRQIAPGGTTEVTHRLFAGAKIVELVERYEEQQGIVRFDMAVDWGWFAFLTYPIFRVLDVFYDFLGNFGVAILLLTVLIKLLFFPLANKSYEAMTRMKKIQPEMQKLNERFKDDAVQKQQAMMELYKREKVNPAAGCLPILIQIPVFFSLYKVLYVTIEMRHAPFFGWIQDLAAPDPTNVFNLFGLLPFTPPSMLHLGLWPLIMGITMWLQQKMNPPAPDPIQQRIFGFMPWIFMFMLASFPAGLVIYWAWNNTLSVLQQWVIMRRMKVEVHLFDNLKNSWLGKQFARARGKASG